MTAEFTPVAHETLPIDIYTGSRRILPWMIIAICVMVFLIMVYQHAEDNFDRGLSIFMMAFTAAGIASKIYLAVKPQLVCSLTDTGILLKQSAMPIAWTDITDVRTVKLQAPVVGIFLKDTEAYLAAQLPIMRKAGELTMRHVGTPVALPAQMTDMTADELAALVETVRRERS